MEAPPLQQGCAHRRRGQCKEVGILGDEPQVNVGDGGELDDVDQDVLGEQGSVEHNEMPDLPGDQPGGDDLPVVLSEAPLPGQVRVDPEGLEEILAELKGFLD